MQKLKVTFTQRQTVTTTKTLTLECSPERLAELITQYADDENSEKMIAVIVSLVRKG